MVLFDVQTVPLESQEVILFRVEFELVHGVDESIKMAKPKVDIQLCGVASSTAAIVFWKCRFMVIGINLIRVETQ